jgi:tetratricopeptide (TPR) repeat protein
MAVVLPYFGVRKDFTAMLMGLQNLLIIEDLIEIGLIREYDNGLIAMQCIIRQFVKTELLPDYDNCRTLITSLRAVCVNESTYVPYKVMCDMLYHTVRCIDFHSFEDYFYLIHDFYKYIERFRDIFIAKQMLNLEEQLRSDNDKQAIVYFSDYASFEMMRNNYSKALELQEDAVHHSLNCDDILLQANTVNTYGYYLNLSDRKEEALKAMQSGLALFEQLDGNGIFYYDKYRAIINYADLLFSLGNKDEAINLVSDTKKSLLNLDLQDTEIYADCLYSLGLYHLCLMKTDNAKDELIRAFKIFLRVHDKDSDFISAKCNELRKFAEMAKVNPQSYLNLNQLLL